jgi:hypothetical protein
VSFHLGVRQTRTTKRLTAYSPTLKSYGGGPGQVALHGRDGSNLADPLGSARSHGCIRIPNIGISLLARVAPEGTPVDVRQYRCRLGAGSRADHLGVHE